MFVHNKANLNTTNKSCKSYDCFLCFADIQLDLFDTVIIVRGNRKNQNFAALWLEQIADINTF